VRIAAFQTVDAPSSAQWGTAAFLELLPLPQGHGALRPTLAVRAVFPADGAGLALFAFWLWAGWHFFIRGWHFLLRA
jgi:hypothetical protein